MSTGSKFWRLTLFLLLLYSHQSLSETSRLLPGSSLSVENPSDVLISPSREFSAGFFKIGENAYSFAIWFTGKRAATSSHDLTVVWMANRETPVNGRLSKLLFRKSGELQLTDAGQTVVWSHNTSAAAATSAPGELKLLDTGNLVLTDRNGAVSWRSFDSPTDTLLPGQELVKATKLVSSRSRTDYSSGNYELFFDDDNVLRLLYKNPEITSIYWPDPWLRSWEAQRYIFNDTRVALLDSLGSFIASDTFTVVASDYGAKLQRRMTIDHDGNLRLYSRRRATSTWAVTWVAVRQPCKIHGICGPNSLCTYLPKLGRKCSCIPGFKMIKESDHTQGCEPDFELPCGKSTAGSAGFARLPSVEFYGYDKTMFFNYTLKHCESECLKLCDSCAAIHYKFDTGSGAYFCYVKPQMRNGYHTPGFNGDIYLKLPKTILSSLRNVQPDYTTQDHNFNCSSSGNATSLLDRTYRKKHLSSLLEFLMWFAIGVGGLELLIVSTVWFFVIAGRENSRAGDDLQGYIQAATGFRKFGYSELKKATKCFSQEIGNGAGGTVYKATLPDNRVAAVKRLRDSNRAEVEFLAEVSTIGRLNHMNLIEMWGYCAEGKHRLLVYEFMEHGSLSDSLSSTALDWEKRFKIAVGTARGLAYLHEECLEWVLHCDVKPQNILLGYNFQPKVADFGLSKLLNRSETGADKNSSFSRIRGTRGYMAPEWVYNLPITSKVDVYSYGIVVLEILTGKNPMRNVSGSLEDQHGVVRPKMLVTWMREKIVGALSTEAWIKEIIDPTMESKYNVKEVEILVQVALRCVEEDRDLRPTMTQVVEMLVSNENDN